MDNPLVRGTISDLVHACLVTFHRHYGVNPMASVLALAALTVVATALVRQVVKSRWHSWLGRRRHHEALDLLARPDPSRGVLIIDHPWPTAYCLAGRGGRVVLSSGAVTTLTPTQLAAVIGHERAHLAGRHHLLVAVAQTCAKVFPFMPLTRRCPTAVRHLVERLADEQACATHDPLQLAAALRTMYPTPLPPAALGMVRIGAEEPAASVRKRLNRLEVGLPTVPRRRGLVVCVGLAVAVAAPVGVGLAPLMGLAMTRHCPIVA